jgi:hypothetical protein
MTESLARRHAVPLFLLRRFADTSGRLMAERRDRSRRLALSVTEAAEGAGLYESGPALAALATVVEARAARAIEALVGGAFPPPADDRAHLAVFIALQLVLGHGHRDAVARTAGLLNQVIVTSLEEALESDATEAGEGEGEPDEAEHGAPMTSTLTRVPAMARLVAARTWQLVRFPGRQLLTGDTPVVLWRRPGTSKPYQHGLAAADEARFPLDPAHALVVARTAPAGEVIRSLEARHARALNRTVAESAHTWMYYHPESDPLEAVELARPAEPD